MTKQQITIRVGRMAIGDLAYIGHYKVRRTGHTTYIVECNEQVIHKVAPRNSRQFPAEGKVAKAQAAIVLWLVENVGDDGFQEAS